MSPRLVHGLVALALAALAAAPGTAVAQVVDAVEPGHTDVPALAREAEVEERLGAVVPRDVALTDSEGRAVTVGELLAGGKPVALVFAYHSCPMLCSVVLDGLATSLRETALVPGRDFTVATVSIDPRDTPAVAAEVKARYVAQAARPELAAAWRFLTGDADETRRLADAVGFHYARDARTGEYAHAAALVFLTPDGRVARYLYGAGFPARDFRFALVEAGEGRAGSTFDRFLLTCYQYDANARSYTPVAMGALKVGSGVFLLALGALLIPLWRHERRRRPAPTTA